MIISPTVVTEGLFSCGCHGSDHTIDSCFRSGDRCRGGCGLFWPRPLHGSLGGVEQLCDKGMQLSGFLGVVKEQQHLKERGNFICG